MKDDFGDIIQNVINVTFSGLIKAETVPQLKNLTDPNEKIVSKVFAEVKSFNQFGELIIKFNEPMKTDINITMINSKISTIGR